MTPKERVLAAFRFEEPDDMVPAWEVESQLYEELLGRAPIVGYEFAKLSSKEKERAIYANAELMIEVAEHTEQCAILQFGGYWEIAPGRPALLWLPDCEAQLAQLHTLKELAGDRFLILGRAGCVPSIPTGKDMAAYCYHLYDHRHEVREEAAQNMRQSIEWGKKQLEAGAQGVVMCSDVAFNNGPFLPPDLVDELIAPNVQLWAHTFKQLGVPTIWHTDGNVTPMIDIMTDARVTALQAIDPIAGMDIISLKQHVYGKMTLIRNVNCLTLQFGTPKEIAEECRTMIESCKAGGGYVFGCSNAVFKGIPIENFLVAVEALRKYGRYDSGAGKWGTVEACVKEN